MVTAMVAAADVLSFWFGPNGPEGPVSDDIRARWWRKSDAFDDEIRQRFGDVHARACAGELDDWCETPRGRLALVIVLDQFSRNLHRGDPRSWAQDPVAQRHCVALIDAGGDRDLPPEGRAFLYMPLMHAEDRELQARSVAVFDALGREHPHLAGLQNYALQHAAIVDRFGHFPHRNATLGRESTDEERAFLEQPGSSF